MNPPPDVVIPLETWLEMLCRIGELEGFVEGAGAQMAEAHLIQATQNILSRKKEFRIKTLTYEKTIDHEIEVG